MALEKYSYMVMEKYSYSILVLCEELHMIKTGRERADDKTEERLATLLDRIEHWTLGPQATAPYDLAVYGLVIETLEEWRHLDFAVRLGMSRFDDAVVWFREMMQAQKRANKIKQKKEAARLKRG